MTRPTGKFNFAGVLVNQITGDGQSQPGSALAAAHHRVEQRVLQMRRNSWPVVFYVDSGGEAIAHAMQRQLERGTRTQNDLPAIRA
ncbi:hypothetical protein D3C72_1920250 [compost metagenome]